MESKRQSSLTGIRPVIKSVVLSEDTSVNERFQNKTLRPILKFQHPLFIAVFKSYFRAKKNKFYSLNSENRKAYINNVFSNDSKFVQQLLGVIIGHFTVEEYAEYSSNSSEFNKRIKVMLKERMLSNYLEEFK